MRKLLIAIRRLFIAILAALVFWTAILMIFEERFVFFPHRFPAGPYDDARFVRGLRELSIPTPDGPHLHAWYAPVDSPIAVVLLSHGNGGNMSYDIQRMRRLQSAGLSVFTYDYRGYGKSDGTPTEDGIIIDATAAYDVLRNDLQVPAESIILWGTSLGGAVTIQLASRRPAAGLILESTFTSAPDVAARAYPFLPVRWLMRTRFRSADLIRTLSIPSLHMHGDLDGVIDVELGRELYEAAPGPKEWYAISGAGHNDTFIVGGNAYWARVTDFVRRCVPR